MQKKKIIVIGAGAGGSALSIYLAQAGHAVTVLEKLEQPGGRCGQIRRDGHVFDLGATLMLMPLLFRSIYADWGEDLDGHLKLLPLHPIYHLHFENHGKLEFSSCLPVLQGQLEAREKGAFGRWLQYFDAGCRQYSGLMGRFLGRNFNHAWEYFHPLNGYYFFRLQAHRIHFNFAKKYFRTPELQAAFTFQNIYVGQSPFAASAAYALLPAMELAQGGWHPQGGMHSIVQSLVSIAQQRGVRFHYNAGVQKILIADSKIVGVLLDDGSEAAADIVVANADLPYVYRHLLPAAPGPARWRRLRYASSAIVFHWGLNRSFPELGHHNIFLAEDYRGGFDGIFKRGSFGDPPHFYLNRPAATDASAAPEDGDSISAIIPAAHLDDRQPQDWDALANRARRAVFQRLAREGLADIEKSIKFEIGFTPPVWQSSLNLSAGAVFGSLHHGLSQVGYLRPANRHPLHPNLYFVGGSTRPGSGVPLVLLSSRLTAERILQDLGNPHPFPRGLIF